MCFPETLPDGPSAEAARKGVTLRTGPATSSTLHGSDSSISSNSDNEEREWTVNRTDDAISGFGDGQMRRRRTRTEQQFKFHHAHKPLSLQRRSNNKSKDVWASVPDVYLPLSHDISANWFGYALNEHTNRRWVQAAIGLAHAITLVLFSLQFPYMLAPTAASIVYQKAGYSYVNDPELAVFDNTAWTYATDYALAIVMAGWVVNIFSKNTHRGASALRWRASLLLVMYCLSVSAGGLAHHFFLTVDMRNTLAFRCLWSLCAGTVTMASTFIGMSATCLHRHAQQTLQWKDTGASHTDADAPWHQRWSSRYILRRLPIIPEFVWIVMGTFATIVCLFGGISFHRPACDIFVAGITQALSSFYMTLYFCCTPGDKDEPSSTTVHPKIKAVGSMCFLMNAPLLPMYPILVQHTPLSLPGINALYHAYLMCSWSMQALSLRHAQGRMMTKEKALR